MMIKNFLRIIALLFFVVLDLTVVVGVISVGQYIDDTLPLSGVIVFYYCLIAVLTFAGLAVFSVVLSERIGKKINNLCC